MHELSIVIDLVALCEENMRANNATEIEEVHVKIGRLSGVEPHLLKVAFETFKKDSVCENAKLVLNLQDVIVRCKECGEQNILKENEFLCPSCDSNKLDVLDGEEMYLMRLVMK
ncbi:MAG: hydrogenase maturation nickel metallochaperone HypA [Campylobacteraceae bacterium]|nr:hydrogenase maturation nickel metallochaperone HypA [Campylobacteraceae bacterium]